MKRIFGVIFSYAVFAFALCLLVGSIMGHLPILIDGKKTSYTLCRALLFFFRILPAVLASGFLLGCSINFGKDSEKAVMRFSRVIMQHFKHVMIISIVLVAILTCTAEIFKPMVLRKKLQLEQAPHLLGEYIKNGKECLENKNYVLAHRYGTQALKILPTSVEGKALIDKSEAVLKAIKKVSQQETPVQEFTPHNEILGETVTSLIKKSREASLDKRWFDCHYYAQLAISAGSPMDSNLNEAKRLASVAWNNLQNAPVVERNKEQLLFLKKRAAYKSLSEGDNIDSYYQFLDIAAQDLTWSSDPDVTKFLAIAKSRVEDQCFFIDETERLETFENFMNVYFTIKHDSGVTDVVYIRGITPVLNGGRMIQYLRGFTMMTFEKNGGFLKSVTVPYAKLLSVPVESFSDETKENLELKKSYKNVPYIMLDSIDRSARGKRIVPEWEFASYLKRENQAPENFVVLSMSFDDFNIACDSCTGAEKMDLNALMKISGRSDYFGYSKEVFGSAFLNRISYPIVMMIIFVLLASFAWNFRVQKEQVFKFVWIFAVPVCTLLLDIFIEVIVTIVSLVNFDLTATSGNSSLLIAFVFYIFVLILASLHFAFKKHS